MKLGVTQSTAAALTLASVFVFFEQDVNAYKPPCRRDYGSPLMNAVADRKVQEVRDLLANGVDPSESTNGAYPLPLTIEGGSTSCLPLRPHMELFKLLVSAGADVTARNFIHLVITKGNIEMLQMAVEAGASMRVRNTIEVTPLVTAVTAGKPEAVEFLLKFGADPNQDAGFIGQRPGRTLLHYAARNPGPDNRIAKLLVDYGATYQINGQTGPFYDLAQFYMTPTGDVGELIDLFSKVGGNINEEADPRLQMLDRLRVARPPHTPLNVGLISTHAPREVFEAMLKKGADPNRGALYALAGRQDFDNVQFNRKSLLQLLFDYGARPGLTPNVGSMDVVEAAERNNPEYAQELKEILKGYPHS